MVATVWGLVLIVAGIALAGWAARAITTRPGWDRRYGPGALLLMLGGFVAIGGLLDLLVIR